MLCSICHAGEILEKEEEEDGILASMINCYNTIVYTLRKVSKRLVQLRPPECHTSSVCVCRQQLVMIISFG